MKFRITVFIILFPLLAEVLISCDSERPIQEVEVSHCNLSVQNLNNEGISPETSQSANIPGEAFGVRLRVNRERYTCQNSTPRFSLITSAQAIIAVYDYRYINLEHVTKIEVISLNDFDDEHPAGSEVSEYFRAKDDYEFEYHTLSAFVDRLATEAYGYEHKDLVVDLFLMEPPTGSAQQQFEILMHLSDGRTLQSTSQTVILQ